MQTVRTCFWFNDQALEAARFYVSLFPNSAVTQFSCYQEGAPLPAGTPLMVEFTLDGVEYQALNGGPHFPLTPAASLAVYCENQNEIDRLWSLLLRDGGKEAQCGWLTDRFGLSWQIVPSIMASLFTSSDKAASQRAFAAMLTMRKLDIAALQAAYSGSL